MSFLAKIDAEMNYILSLINQISNSSKTRLIKPQKPFEKNKNTNSLFPTNQEKYLSNIPTSVLTDNYSHLITAETFPINHLCNRDIRDLSLLNGNDVDFNRLRSCYILTLTDLIGRYLIHKTPDDFRTFLIEKVQCGEPFTDEIIELITKWTLNNLLIGNGTRTTTFK